jgi:hypothetical protein
MQMHEHRERIEQAEHALRRIWRIVGIGVSLILLAIIYQAAEVFADEAPEAPELRIEELILERETPREGYRFWTPEDIPVGAEISNQKMGRRPLDDSDPEMRDLAETFFGQGSCNRGPGLRCPEAKAPLQAGGDRLASYLIRQYDESLLEGYPDTATILTAIAGTESKTGSLYIESLVDAPRDDRERDFALSALRECASERCVDAALRVLDRTSALEPATRAAAIRAIAINVDEGKLDRPDAVAALRSLAEADAPGLDRMAAQRALRALGE